MDIILISLQNPRDMVIVVPTVRNHFAIHEIEYGADLIDTLKDTNLYDLIEFEDRLPEAIRENFDWKRRYADRFSMGYIYKKTNKQ